MILHILLYYISQGSAATQLRCGGMFSNQFITNFSQNAECAGESTCLVTCCD